MAHDLVAAMESMRPGEFYMITGAGKATEAKGVKAEQLMTVRAAVEIERAGMVGSDEYEQVWEGVLSAFGLPGFTEPMSLDQEATLERLVETVERITLA